MICDKLLVKFDLINEQTVPRTSEEDKKFLNIKYQYKVTCTSCGRYGYKVKY